MTLRLAFPAVLVAAAGGSALARAPIASPDVPPASVWVPTGGGTLRVLDKQKGEGSALSVRTGQTIRYETLSITLDSCMTRAPGVPADAAGHLTVTDDRQGEPGFNGWMFADEPWVSMLQSPVYGIRVVGCEKPTAEAVAAALPPKSAVTPSNAGAATSPATTGDGAPPDDAPSPDGGGPSFANPPPGQDLGAPPPTDEAPPSSPPPAN